MRPALGQGWTLNYEMMFYMLFSTCLLLPTRHGAKVVTATVVALTILGALLQSPIDGDQAHTALVFWTRPIILLFGAGMAVSFLTRRLPTLDIFAPLPLAAAILCIPVLVQSFVLRGTAVSPALTYAFWVLYIIAVGIVVLARQPAHPNRAAEFLGNASYCTYLTHGFVLLALAKVWPHLPASIPAWLLIVAAIVLGQLIGGGVYQFIQKPIDQILRGLGRARSVPHLAQAPT